MGLSERRACSNVGADRKMIRVDQGSEFISRDLDIWAYQNGVVLHFSRPGKPTDNSFIESFNGKFRDECLSMEWFRNRVDAKIVIENWRRHYNEVRPHSSLGQLTPAQFKQQLSTTTPERAVF